MAKIKIVLGSKSPRRQELVKELGFEVEVRIKEVDEVYPDTLTLVDVPEFLAKLKSAPLVSNLEDNEVLLTSDTVVIHNGALLGKPKDREDAIQMLKRLSNSSHTVVTGVSLISTKKTHSFSSHTEVYFSEISETDIITYVDQYKPFDKAGSYGIQEWLGYISVEKIDGCYYNVMGLPLHDTYKAITANFI
ncbi:MAG: septum formation protein Maf [Crocinitomicaceae bacterium]|nr:septum formation protein Maf [Crocinitomicaceae bacterium]